MTARVEGEVAANVGGLVLVHGSIIQGGSDKTGGLTGLLPKVFQDFLAPGVLADASTLLAVCNLLAERLHVLDGQPPTDFVVDELTLRVERQSLKQPRLPAVGAHASGDAQAEAVGETQAHPATDAGVVPSLGDLDLGHNGSDGGASQEVHGITSRQTGKRAG